MESGRKVFIGGNWKCNGDIKFVKDHCDFLKSIQFDTNKCEVIVCPTNIHLQSARDQLNGSNVHVCSQNVGMNENGAFTGEVSAKQLVDFGLEYTLIAHSERRQLFGDDETTIGNKIQKALNYNLNVVFCIGEKLDDRNNDKTMDVCINQLKTLVANVTVQDQWNKIVIAYEPVWAIGTGKTATPEMAQEVHQGIRKWINENVSQEVAQRIRIIYGGSVSEGNCNALIKENDIDGFLVGGASLKKDFEKIIMSYSQ